MNFKPGDAFLLDSGESCFDHLWFVLTEEINYEDRHGIICVNLTSYIDDGEHEIDPACILYPKDHKYIKHKSCIMYRLAKCVKRKDLQFLLKKDCIIPQPRLQDDVLKKIRAGCLISNEAKEKLKILIKPYLK